MDTHQEHPHYCQLPTVVRVALKTLGKVGTPGLTY